MIVKIKNAMPMFKRRNNWRNQKQNVGQKNRTQKQSGKYRRDIKKHRRENRNIKYSFLTYVWKRKKKISDNGWEF